MRQQLPDLAGALRGQAREHVLQVGVGSSPLSLADWIRLITAAALLRARSASANSQLLRPMAIGRIWFSIQLLSTGKRASSANRVSAAQRFKL